VSSLDLEIPTAEVFEPLLEPARDKAAYGGRGSGKSHFFAGMMVEDAERFPGDSGEGLRAICGREIQKSLKDSAKHLIETKLNEFGLGEAQGFKIFNDRIQTPKDGVIIFQGLQDHTTDSIKSFEGFHRFWGEEAHSISARSVGLIRPTIRWENKRLGLTSEMWWSWNPMRKVDAVDVMFRGPNRPTGAVVVRANWSDNPWFPDVLNQERIDCLKNNPEQYDHIWEGGYATITEGAYYAKQLAEARAQGRIGRVARDPLMTIRAYWDIGGTGAKADACAIWIAQFIGREIRVLDYYEAVGQELAEHVAWLRRNGYEDALCILPHDGAHHDKIVRITYEGAIRQAGFKVRVVENQGKGAVSQRIETVRRLFPMMWIHEPTCSAGLDALGWYHEKKDEERGVGLGPEHDWSSHGADAFGLMAIDYDAPGKSAKKIQYSNAGIV
jgi:phage terminase large subunit